MVAAEHDFHPDSGVLLIQALQKAAETCGDDLADLGARMRMTESSWISFLNRRRSVETLTRTQLKAMADYLGRPLVYVMSLAELVRPEDFVSELSVAQQLNEMYERLRLDQTYGVFTPSAEQWNDTPYAAKVLIALMYGRLSERDIIGPTQIVQAVRDASKDGKRLAQDRT
jgi:hypothetical protein